MYLPIVITIHDAVSVEALEEEAQEVRDLAKTQMEAAVEMPLVALEVFVE